MIGFGSYNLTEAFVALSMHIQPIKTFFFLASKECHGFEVRKQTEMRQIATLCPTHTSIHYLKNDTAEGNLTGSFARRRGGKLCLCEYTSEYSYFVAPVKVCNLSVYMLSILCLAEEHKLGLGNTI